MNDAEVAEFRAKIERYLAAVRDLQERCDIVQTTSVIRVGDSGN